MWKAAGGRDALAAKAGITPPGTLSAYNSGSRPLGVRNGKKLADALGLTIYDLGAPSDPEMAEVAPGVLDRLGALEARAASLNAENARLDQLVVGLTARVEHLEGAAASRGSTAT